MATNNRQGDHHSFDGSHNKNAADEFSQEKNIPRNSSLDKGKLPSRYKTQDQNNGYDDLDQTAHEAQTGQNEKFSGETISNPTQGRDYEQNAGYRESYNRLTTGQWPEIEEARRRRDEVEHRNVPAGVTHRGKGPRSPERSDITIKEEIHVALKEDAYIDASTIQVNVKKGEVILTGLVDTKQLKKRVETLVESIPGVKQTDNRLRSRLPGGNIVNIENKGE